MAKDPVCGKEIDEAEARAQTGQTMHGASEVDPQQGTRSFHNGQWFYSAAWIAAPSSWLLRRLTWSSSSVIPPCCHQIQGF